MRSRLKILSRKKVRDKMRWYVFYFTKNEGGKVMGFDTKEQAEMFADLIGRENVRSIYQAG